MAEGKKKGKGQTMSLGQFVNWADESDDPNMEQGGHHEERPQERTGGSDYRDQSQGGDRGGFGSREGGDRGGFGSRERGPSDRSYGGDRGGYGGGDRGGYGGDRDRGYGGDRGGYSRDGDRERRPERQPLPVPDEPPFIAYVGNLPFNATEEDIDGYLGQHCKIKSVRLIREDGRSKGYAYVEFQDRTSLTDALSANGVDFMGRGLRVDVAAEPRNPSRGGSGFGSSGFGGDRGGRRDEQAAPSQADLGPWRRGEALPPAPERPTRSFGDRDQQRERPFGDRDRRADSGADSGATERKKINLQKRSVPVDEVARVPAPVDYSKAKSNPFGSAKPRDESAILKKKEQERSEREKKEGKRDDKAEATTSQVVNKFAALSTDE